MRSNLLPLTTLLTSSTKTFDNTISFGKQTNITTRQIVMCVNSSSRRQLFCIKRKRNAKVQKEKGEFLAQK